jgi:uncharacterized protein DUF4154
MRKVRYSALCLGLSTALLAQNLDLERHLKATFIYNFAQYTEWPRQALGDQNPFVICVAGDSFQDVLEQTVRNETIGGHPISIKRISSPEDARTCHLIFFQETIPSKSVMDILAAIATSPILTVGEDPGFVRSGGMIRFTKSGNRIRFEINPNVAEKASLRISSRLLRLADIAKLEDGGR